MKLLNEDTLVPLGLSIAVIGSATFWLSAVSAKVDSHEKVLVEQKTKQEKTAEDLGQIKVDIGVIKQILIGKGKER